MIKVFLRITLVVFAFAAFAASHAQQSGQASVYEALFAQVDRWASTGPTTFASGRGGLRVLSKALFLFLRNVRCMRGRILDASGCYLSTSPFFRGCGTQAARKAGQNSMSATRRPAT